MTFLQQNVIGDGMHLSSNDYTLMQSPNNNNSNENSSNNNNINKIKLPTMVKSFYSLWNTDILFWFIISTGGIFVASKYFLEKEHSNGLAIYTTVTWSFAFIYAIIAVSTSSHSKLMENKINSIILQNEEKKQRLEQEKLLANNCGLIPENEQNDESETIKSPINNIKSINTPGNINESNNNNDKTQSLLEGKFTIE